MSDVYRCNECEFESKSVAGVRIHASSENKKIYLLNEDNDDDEEEEDEDDGPTTSFKRCLYGMCSLQQILFKTPEDLKVHLPNEHDIIEGE